MRIIDIASVNGNVDLALAQRQGVEGVVLRAGGADNGAIEAYYNDSKFEQLYTQAKSLGLHIGAYYLFNARENKHVERHVSHFDSLVKGKQLDLGIYFDIEGDVQKWGYTHRDELTLLVDSACSKMEKLNYWVGIYGANDNLVRAVDVSQLKDYGFWWANYHMSTVPNVCGEVVNMWQTGQQFIANKSLDVNQLVKSDLCEKIRASKRNGFNARTHVVQSGETLWGIANKCCDNGAKWMDIMRANNLSSTVIYKGQVLIIP